MQPALETPQPDASAGLALKGVRVLDFSRLIAGPYSAMLLGDLGADVIKIEQPGKGDDSRHLSPDLDNAAGGAPSSVFLCMNRGKRSIELDLKSAEGCAVARDLIARSDVLIENFSSGVMDRIGLGYETASQLNPRLVYCSISAFGREGEFAGRPGFDPIAQADSGLFSLNGYPDRPPTRTGAPVVDVGSGLTAWGAILAALLARQATGRGQRVQVALFDVAIALTGMYSMNYLLTGADQQRSGNSSFIAQPQNLFAARNGDFYLSCSNDKLFRQLARRVLQRPELAEMPEYKTNSERCRNATALNRMLAGIFSEADREYWVELLLAEGIPAGMVRSIGEAINSPEMQDRGLVSRIAHPTCGSVPNIAAPLRLEETPLVPPRAAPLLGQHTRDVLAGELGYDDAKIAELQQAGAFGTA